MSEQRKNFRHKNKNFFFYKNVKSGFQKESNYYEHDFYYMLNKKKNEKNENKILLKS